MGKSVARRHLDELSNQIACKPNGISARDVAKKWYEEILKNRGRPEADSAFRLYSIVSMSCPETVTQNIYAESVKMAGDTYNSSGQIGAVGPNAHVHDVNFQQLWLKEGAQIDLANTAKQLELLRTELKARAKTAEDDVAIAAVASAEVSAKKGDGEGMLKQLATCGKAVIGVAKDIGVEVAAAVICKACGISS